MGDDNDSFSEDTSSEESSSGDSYTETSSQSWGERLMESIKGVLVGVILFIVAFPVLWWNEGRAVRTAEGLKEGAAAVVSIKADAVDAGNNGKLVHLTGQAVTDETLTDETFKISMKGIRLQRNVEMFQWKEEVKSDTKKKIGGGTETVKTYNYKTGWSNTAIDSSNFKKPQGHKNPAMQYKSEQVSASTVKIGAYRLNKGLMDQITGSEALPVKQEDLAKLPADIKAKAKLDGNAIYIGANPASPQVGDMKISFSVVKPQVVSLIAKQNNDTFEAFQTKNNTSIMRLEAGEKSAQSMFGEMQSENKTMTWILRVVGFFLMFIGISMVFKPLVTVADVLPFLGSVLSMGVGIVAFIIALPLTLVTIALAWIAHRPILAIALLAIGGAVFAGVYIMSKKKKEAAAA